MLFLVCISIPAEAYSYTLTKELVKSFGVDVSTEIDEWILCHPYAGPTPVLLIEPGFACLGPHFAQDDDLYCGLITDELWNSLIPTKDGWRKCSNKVMAHNKLLLKNQQWESCMETINDCVYGDE